jgi:L-lactate dehydrogenase complex protein LldG
MRLDERPGRPAPTGQPIMNPTSREAFLERVRQAVQAGNRSGSFPLQPRGQTGYQGAGADPVARFSAECAAAGGQVHVVSDRESAGGKVIELVQGRAARSALVGQGSVVDPLGLAERLRSLGIEVMSVGPHSPATARAGFFAAEVGITGVDYLIAETGTVVLKARPGEPRSLSLLPPMHIVVADRSQLLPDLFDLFKVLGGKEENGPAHLALPSCVSLITGPSKTGDIELRLVTGVHGPGEIHVILIA